VGRHGRGLPAGGAGSWGALPAMIFPPGRRRIPDWTISGRSHLEEIMKDEAGPGSTGTAALPAIADRAAWQAQLDELLRTSGEQLCANGRPTGQGGRLAAADPEDPCHTATRSRIT